VTKHKNFTLDDAPALMAFLAGAGIKLVDVGGRGAAMGQLLPLAPVAHYVTCEPDAEEAQRLRDTLPQDTAWRSVTVVTEAIAPQRGDVTLYLTRQLGMSSLLEPDPRVTEHFYLSQKFCVERTTTVPAIPLDDAAAQYGFTDACFLKIDTQGTELDILQSGPRLVQDSLLGVYVECSFRPFYKGQALFSDVDSHLRRNGFSLFNMSRANLRRTGYRSTLYSKRVTTWAHCLYLREPDTLTAMAMTQGLPRLLALAMAFQQHDLAFEVVALAGRAGLLSGTEVEQVTADVENVVTVATAVLTRKAAKHGLAETLLAPDFRDRKRLE
jgi:FkbM family methyltransferase